MLLQCLSSVVVGASAAQDALAECCSQTLSCGLLPGPHSQHLGLLQILLLDEPLAGLDWQTRAEVATTLAELKRRCTVLVVSHDLRELVPLVSWSWWLLSLPI